jgi:hypothetical protein
MPARAAPDMNLAESAAITMSQAQTSPNPPPPAANPCTAAITGARSASRPCATFCNQAVASRR